MFGNRRLPSVELLSTKSRDLLGSGLAWTIACIAGERFETVDDLPGPFWIRTGEVDCDLDLRLPTPLAELAHVRPS